MTNSDDSKLDDFQNPDEELDINMFFDDNAKVDDELIDSGFPDKSLLGENTATFADELDMFDDLESVAESVEQTEMIDHPILAAIENVPVVEDKKAKKAREKAEKAQAIAQAKAEKAQAKTQAKAAGKAPKEKSVKAEKPPKTEKPPKAKKVKKPKEPGDKQPLNTATLAFMAGLVLMLLVFGGVNAYTVLKHGVGGAMFFLAIFDLLAFIAIVISIFLRRSKDTVTASDVGLGIAAISLIVGCMFVLANVAL